MPELQVSSNFNSKVCVESGRGLLAGAAGSCDAVTVARAAPDAFASA